LEFSLVGSAISKQNNSSRWDGLIVLCAANNLDGVKLADQQVAERLCAKRPVLFVDPPISVLSGLKSSHARKSLKDPRLRLQAPGLARLTPVVQPFPSRGPMVSLTNALLGRIVRQAANRLSKNVTAVISAWPMHPVLGRCGEKVKVYWAQDDFVGGAPLLGMDPARLAAGELRSAKGADVIIAANPTVADTWRSRGYDPRLIPYGVDTAAYAGDEGLPRPPDIRLQGPIAGFVGHINDRIDVAFLEAIASTGIGLLLIGPRGKSTETEQWIRLLNLPNVQWVGPKPFLDLPSYYQSIDVGIVPYNDCAFNIGSFPLKTLEYLASGLPVVSTNLPASRWLDTKLITIADTPAAFAQATRDWAQHRRNPLEAEERRAFARNHDWLIRVNTMIDAIDQVANP
jgi:glycosyltransferase involved in cell wall biosynthesis